MEDENGEEGQADGNLICIDVKVVYVKSGDNENVIVEGLEMIGGDGADIEQVKCADMNVKPVICVE